MTTLNIYLFGHVRIIPEGGTESIKLRRSSQALLAYLLLQPGRLFSRDQIIDAFWAERDRRSGHNCLTSALWRLRTALELGNAEAHMYVLKTDAGEIGFNWQSSYWLDVECFEQAVAPLLRLPVPAMVTQDATALEQALTLYQGELLEDVYEDWALRARERLCRLYLNGLAHLMHYHAHHHDYNASLAYGRQILEIDPLREEIHRAVMRLYVESGQRARAVRQYEICRRILQEELGIPPMAETETLYRAIADSCLCGHKAVAFVSDTLLPKPVQDAVELAMQRVEMARHQLEESVKLLQAHMAKLESLSPDSR